MYQYYIRSNSGIVLLWSRGRFTFSRFSEIQAVSMSAVSTTLGINGGFVSNRGNTRCRCYPKVGQSTRLESSQVACPSIRNRLSSVDSDSYHIDKELVLHGSNTGATDVPGGGEHICHTVETPFQGMASLSRMAMQHSGVAVGSHSAMRISRGSIYQQPTTASGSGGGTRPLAPAISSALVIGATVGTAVVAAIKSMVKAVRECSNCQGYGVQRCRLCSGKGTIDWEGKMSHREPCPMCLGRRLHKCTSCGGGILFSRSLFNHKANKGEDALMETLQTLTTPSRRLFGPKRGDDQQEARLLESDEYSKEVITD